MIKALQAGGHVIFIRHSKTEKDYAEQISAKMGDCCDGEVGEPSAADSRRRRRRGEVNPRLHCSLIATCLTLGDLRRIEQRFTIDSSKDASDDTIHSDFVVWAGQRGPIARQRHKVLDRR